MREPSLQQFYDKVLNLKHKYCGTLDENGHRIGAGCQHWNKDNNKYKYSGQFQHNNLQNKAVYIIDKNGDQTYYDGFFHCNRLEGYGKVIYANQTSFEGLFKQNFRFGPGVLTYWDNTQDVGIWDGFKLRRLIVSTGENVVPRLGENANGKAKLLKFRALVPLCPEIEDIGKKVLIELNAPEEVLENSNLLYNSRIRNLDSLFCDKSSYSDFSPNDCTIDVVVSESEFLNSSSEESELPEQSLEIATSCCCFQQNLDTFGHISVQLHDVELKLQKLKSKKEKIEQQLKTCKYCCTHIQVDHASDEAVNKSSEKKSCTPQEDVSSNEGTTNSLTQSEIELQTYLYSISATDFTEHRFRQATVDTRCSTATLPFHHSNLTSLPITTDQDSKVVESLCNQFHVEETVEYDETEKLQACICNVMLVDNVDILQEKLKEIQQKEAFYTTVKTALKNHLDAEFSRLNLLTQEETRFMKKVTVTDLLAWNNEEIWIAVLQHCFRNRSSENNVSFKVQNLLTSHRHFFEKPGIYEIECRKFLEECIQGNDKQVFGYFKTGKINPDLCDARGNTGLMLATVSDQHHVIVMLVNCGAKIDVMNDEGLTPLAIALLRYIATKFKIVDWEKAFLREEEQIYLEPQWFPADSLLTVYSNLVSESKTEHEKKEENEELTPTLLDVQSSGTQPYFFNTDFIRIHKEKAKSGTKMKKKSKKNKNPQKTKKSKEQKKSTKTKKSKEIKQAKTVEDNTKNEPDAVPLDDMFVYKLKTIKRTVMTLLHCGSDPNIGEVPSKLIFLAIFTNDSDFLYGLLKNKADPNIKNDRELTSFHIIASLKPSAEIVKMCEVLLLFEADSNVKTSSNHWPEMKKEVLGEDIDVVDEGKNVLHLISLREDFSEDVNNYLAVMANILVLNGCTSCDLYLGHTPLSLAVLRGNTALVAYLLKTKLVDPHQLLGNNMGNALTVLILNRFQSILPDDKVPVARTLLDFGLNPLTPVGDFENSITFMENEYSLSVKQASKKDLKRKPRKDGFKKSPQASSKKKSTKASSKKKSSKKSQQSSTSNQDKIIPIDSYIVSSSKEILFRHLQGRAVEYSYILITEGFVDPLTEIWTKFVNLEEALRVLQLLFQYEVLKYDRFDHGAICNYLDYLRLHQELQNKWDENEPRRIEELVKNTSWKKIHKSPNEVYLPPPEVDKNTKYVVCFHCLKARDKDLLRCPSCELVYFCSQECNIRSIKSTDSHLCNIVFYNELEQKLENLDKQSRFQMLLQIADKMKQERDAIVSNIDKKRIKSPVSRYMKTEPAKRVVSDISKIRSSHFLGSLKKRKSEIENSRTERPKPLTTVFFQPNLEEYLELLPNKSKAKRVSDMWKEMEEGRSSFQSKQTKGTQEQGKVAKKSLVPNKNYYMNLLSKVFADFNLPLLLLPYACYKDGQVYYKMSGSNTAPDFYQLTIPK